MGRCAPFLVLDLGLDVVDGVGGLHLEGDGLSSEGFDENLHSIKRGVLMRVAVEVAGLWATSLISPMGGV